MSYRMQIMSFAFASWRPDFEHVSTFSKTEIFEYMTWTYVLKHVST